MVSKHSEELRYKLRYPRLTDICCTIGIPLDVIDNAYSSINHMDKITKDEFEVAIKSFIVTYTQFNTYYTKGCDSRSMYNLRIALASGFVATGMKYLNDYKDKIDRYK